jgi:hypothetical protein
VSASGVSVLRWRSTTTMRVCPFCSICASSFSRDFWSVKKVCVYQTREASVVSEAMTSLASQSPVMTTALGSASATLAMSRSASISQAGYMRYQPPA